MDLIKSQNHSLQNAIAIQNQIIKLLKEKKVEQDKLIKIKEILINLKIRGNLISQLE